MAKLVKPNFSGDFEVGERVYHEQFGYGQVVGWPQKLKLGNPIDIVVKFDRPHPKLGKDNSAAISGWSLMKVVE